MADASPFSKIYAFGDSLSDAGNLFIIATERGLPAPISPPYFQETYTLGSTTNAEDVFSNGPTWVQNLSLALGLGTLAPSLLGGTDFAYGSAETGPTPETNNFPQGTEFALPAQLSQFEAVVPSPSPNALYTLWVGTVDIIQIAADDTLTPAQQQADVTASVNNEISAVNELVRDGATNLLVVDVPDIGGNPADLKRLLTGSFSSLAAAYNAQLNADLDVIAKPDGLNLHILDAYQVYHNMFANPSGFRLTNVTDPVWSGNVVSINSGTLVTSDVAVQNQYLFFDGIHPTETVHTILANDALAALAGPVACFAAGAGILTTRGIVAVEALNAGDEVITHADARRTIRWVGHRRIDCRRHPRPELVLPVRVRADAFGHGLPARDLRLSPDHAVFIYGVLIPIRALINGVTVRPETVAEVTYYHVELPEHDVILAEGLPAESYLDLGNRGAFDNGDGALVLHPDFATRTWADKACAELIFGGPILAAVRERLLLQARLLGHAITDDPDLRLRVARRIVRPDHVGGGFRFMLPPGARTARLLSRVHPDARRLGVGVAELLLDRQPVSDARLQRGWRPAAPGRVRWTDGDARIDVQGARELIVRIESSGRYWTDPPIERRAGGR